MAPGRHLVRQPLWLLGQGAWVVALGLQALALHVGRLSVVQPVLVSELVFVLIIRAFVMHWPVADGGLGFGGAARAARCRCSSSPPSRAAGIPCRRCRRGCGR